MHAYRHSVFWLDASNILTVTTQCPNTQPASQQCSNIHFLLLFAFFISFPFSFSKDKCTVCFRNRMPLMPFRTLSGYRSNCTAATVRPHKHVTVCSCTHSVRCTCLLQLFPWIPPVLCTEHSNFVCVSWTPEMSCGLVFNISSVSSVEQLGLDSVCVKCVIYCVCVCVRACVRMYVCMYFFLNLLNACSITFM
jgi:hypothetical protein